MDIHHKRFKIAENIILMGKQQTVVVSDHRDEIHHSLIVYCFNGDLLVQKDFRRAYHIGVNRPVVALYIENFYQPVVCAYELRLINIQHSK